MNSFFSLLLYAKRLDDANKIDYYSTKITQIYGIKLKIANQI